FGPKPARSLTPAQGSVTGEEPTVSARTLSSLSADRGEEPTRRDIPLPAIPPAPPPLLIDEDELTPIVSVRHPPLGASSAPPAGGRSSRPPPLPAAARRASEPARSVSASEVPTTTSGKVAKARARLVNGAREE